tara:strand:- start:702 stop:947 length:246 start_codon:yes stop_codon:yes gene_type:complete
MIFFNTNEIYALTLNEVVEEKSIKNEEYLDFSYISFVIQMIIGGVVAGFIWIIAYYGKFMDFISKIFNKSKETSNKLNDKD